MARINGISHLPSEIQKQMNKFDLSKVHITTMDYLQFRPVYSRELVPHEVVNMDARLFTRLTPMVKPAFAHATIETRGFYVPYRTICSWFNDFISQSKSKDDVLHSSVASLTYLNILYGLVAWNNAEEDFYDITHTFGHFLTKSQYDDGETPDIIVPDVSLYDLGSGIIRCGLFKLNANGKNAVAQLMTLGYNFPLFPFEPTTGRPFTFIGTSQIEVGGISDWILDLSGSSIQQDVDNYIYNIGVPKYSALPLFSLLKVYSDWFENPQFEYVTTMGTSKKLLTLCEAGRSLYAEEIYNMLLCLSRVAYDDDYFTTISTKYLDQRGIDTVVSINDSSLSSLPDTQKSSVVSNSSNGTNYTPFVIRSDNGTATPTRLSQFIIDSLSALTKVMRRFNIVGNKTIDRYLARFGVKLEAEKLNRSVYLGNMQTDIDVMDVMSLADTDNAILGDYAGKGMGASNGNFNYKCQEEFGQMIIVSIIKPYVSYFQGTPRELSHLGMNDFFSGAYDNLGYQAVGIGELVSSEDTNNTHYVQGGSSDSDYYQDFWPTNHVLGFQPRYAEYKCNQQDLLTGDMRYYSKGRNSYNYFHQFRGFRFLFNTADLVNQQIKTAFDAAQYDRIFATTNNDYDHFIVDMFFKVTSIKPMLPLFDSVEFDEDNKQDHRVVNVPVAGTKF